MNNREICLFDLPDYVWLLIFLYLDPRALLALNIVSKKILFTPSVMINHNAFWEQKTANNFPKEMWTPLINYDQSYSYWHTQFFKLAKNEDGGLPPYLKQVIFFAKAERLHELDFKKNSFFFIKIFDNLSRRDRNDTCILEWIKYSLDQTKSETYKYQVQNIFDDFYEYALEKYPIDPQKTERATRIRHIRALLFSSIQYNQKLEEVKGIVEALLLEPTLGVDINSRYPRKKCGSKCFPEDSPLMVAIRWNRPDVVKFLIEQGANVIYNNSYNPVHYDHPIYLAIEYNHPEVFNILADYIINHIQPSDRQRFLYELLFLAINKESFDILNILIKIGADINGRCQSLHMRGDFYNVTPLFIAVVNNKIKMVKALLSYENINTSCSIEEDSYWLDTNKDTKDILRQDDTLFEVAIKLGYEKIVWLLLNHDRPDDEALNKAIKLAEKYQQLDVLYCLNEYQTIQFSEQSSFLSYSIKR